MKYGDFKFSAYPWRVSSPNQNFGPKVWGADDRLVADCGNVHNRTAEEEAANAQLIAYAPELLEMIIELNNRLDEFGQVWGIDDEGLSGRAEMLIKKPTTI